MGTFKADDVVWANLGFSYGWWPSVVCERKKHAEMTAENADEPTDDGSKVTSKSIAVKFFDDDKFESYCLPDDSLVQPYSCPSKVDFVKEGLMRFGQSSKDFKLGMETRQSQFIKDVEMAEVLTDNSLEVGEMLSKYAFLDEEEEEPAEEEPRKKKRKPQRKRKKC